jgi:hypothetical protein
MTALALVPGPLQVDGLMVQRSGIRWLVASGQQVRAGEPIGYCNIGLVPAGFGAAAPPELNEESQLQIVFATRVGGRIDLASHRARGGYLDVIRVTNWSPDEVLCHIEPDGGTEVGAGATRLRLAALAGRRAVEFADVTAGLMPGWLDRCRGWWLDDDEDPATLLSLGICDATGVIRGETGAFLEIFEAAPFAAHITLVPHYPLVPAAPMLLDQMRRTPAQFEAIAADLHAGVMATKHAATSGDLLLAGTLLSAMQKNPIKDRAVIFSGGGLKTLRPAEAILMSLNAEPQTVLRHRKLGYHLHLMPLQQMTSSGSAMRDWLADSFEPVRRSIDDIRRDYEEFVEAVAHETGARVMILNRMSTAGEERISTYSAFDAPMSDMLANIASKELNLMLEDMADAGALDVVDVDAIAAALGGGEHLPDGIHQSAAMQAVVRREVLALLEGIHAANRLGAVS